MSSAKWPHLKELLDETLRRSSAERSAFLTDACGSDEELRSELESLAAASDDAGAFLDVPASLALTGATRLTTTFETWATPGPMSGPPERFPSGALINGRYHVERLVGEGGMGSVYRVRDTALSRTLALKAIRGGPHFLNLFKTEFRTLAELRHPHLAQSYDFEPIAGSTDCCFTMEFVDGRSIFDATEGLGWTGVVGVLVQLCRVLAYVHNRGIIHRDIKPSNVLVVADGTLKLVDFGLVGSVDDARHVMGTLPYLAPELMNREQGDHRTDFYSLGMLAYQLICRRLPDGLDIPELLRRDTESLSVPDDVDAPDWLKDVITRLCARLPSDRYRSANQIIEAINADGGLHYPIETAVTRESYVLSGRFVGRHDEFTALSAFVDRRLAGTHSITGPIALVSGQSGIGKSRLVRELRHTLQLNRVTCVEGNCFEGAAREFGAVAEVLAQLVPVVVSRGGTAIVERDLGALATMAPELVRDREIAAPSPLISPEAERLRLLDTVAGFLVEASSVFPYVLYFNDLHWAQRGTIDVLRHLHRRVTIDERRGAHMPLAVVVSYRPDETTGRPVEVLLGEIHGSATDVCLDPLPPQPMRRLLESMFGLKDIPDSFVSRVLDEAHGSPFFLEEVVRTLVENGSVFVESGAWQTATAVGDLEIPASIVATMRRRLEMVIEPGQHRVLRILAAYQKPMPVPLLASIANLRFDETQDALRELTARNLVAASGGRDLYRSAHDHVRTTVYGDLGSDAPALHLQIARTLESASDTLPLSELAHHYWLAKDSPLALRYAVLAGESAASVYANDEAIEHLTHAMALMPLERNAERARIAEQLADAHFLVGHYGQAKSLLMDVDRDAETSPLDRTRIQRKLGEVAGYSEGNPGAAVDILWTAAEQLGVRRPRSQRSYFARTLTALGRHFVQRAALRLLSVAAGADDRKRLAELAGIYLRISHLSFFADPRLTVLPVFRAANLVDRLGESKEHTQVYAMVAVALAGLNLRGRALRYGEEAIAEAERLGSASLVANARNFHATVLIETGRWQQAVENAEQARHSFAAGGDHFQLAISLYTILEVLHGRGELQTGVARGREELAVFERLGLQMIGKGPYTVFGQLLTKSGDIEGISIGRDVLARAAQGRDRLSTAWAHVALGDSLLQIGHVDEAIDHLERGLAIRDANRFNMYLVAPGDALLATAYAAKLRSGRAAVTEVAMASLERQVSRAIAVGNRFLPMRSSAWLVRGLLSRLRGRPSQAMAFFAEAERHAAHLGARLWQADACFERGLALIEFDGRDSAAAREALGQALGLFRACGARFREQIAGEALEKVDAAVF